MAAILRLEPGGLLSAADARVIRAEEYARVLDAEEIVADAQQRAAEILAAAEVERAAERQRGYDDGLAEARAESASRMLALVERSVAFLGAAERDVARIVMLSLRRILGDMPEEDVVIRAARSAIGLVRGEARASLRVRPDAAESVRARVSEILTGTSDVGFLDVVPDEALGQGGCRLETEIGVVDASIEVQLAALEAVMTRRIGLN